MLLVASLLMAVGMGLAVAWLLRPQAESWHRQLPLLLFLAVGVGLGTSSLWFFLWLAMAGPRTNAFVGSEGVIIVVLGLLVVADRRRNRLLAPRPNISQSTGRLWYLPAAAFIAALAVAGLAFTRYSAAAPHGAWDAWGDWNLRARFLYLGGPDWTDVFSARATMPHRDYPLLISASVARCWTYLKNASQLAPIAISFLFTFATAGVLFAGLSLLRSRSQGLLAATILLATPFFLVLGAAQYADVPLGFFFLSTLVLLCLHERSGSQDKRGLALAGVMAGLAVWTKNEGGLFLACLLLSHSMFTLRKRRPKGYQRELRSFMAGLLPVLAPVALFKLRFAWHTELLAPHGMLHRLGEMSRYRIVFSSVGDALLHFGSWALSLPPLLLLYLLLVGIEKRSGRVAAKMAAATLGLTALGYLFIYLTTWLPLQWLLLTSLTRLCIQLYPSALFLLFYVARTPEEALRGSAAHSAGSGEAAARPASAP